MPGAVRIWARRNALGSIVVWLVIASANGAFPNPWPSWTGKVTTVQKNDLVLDATNISFGAKVLYIASPFDG